MCAYEETIPQRLLKRLEELGHVLDRRGDAIALIGLGSVGVDLDRLDDHSDLDFFVVVDAPAKTRYLDSIDWLEALCAVAFSFSNSVDGRKVLFADGLFAEYAVFTYEEVERAAFTPGRVVWQRADAPAGLEQLGRLPGPSPYHNVDYQVNEVITNLYVGLHRELRGERLSATRFIQTLAVDRAITLLGLLHADAGKPQDAFALERGVERRFGADVLPLAEIVLGYARNREAAAAMLVWLEAHADVDPVMAAAVRELMARVR